MYVTATVEKMTRSTLVPAKAAMLIVFFMLVISEMGNTQQCHSIAAAYRAKRNGRDRIEIHLPPPPPKL